MQQHAAGTDAQAEKLKQQQKEVEAKLAQVEEQARANEETEKQRAEEKERVGALEQALAEREKEFSEKVCVPDSPWYVCDTVWMIDLRFVVICVVYTYIYIFILLRWMVLVVVSAGVQARAPQIMRGKDAHSGFYVCTSTGRGMVKVACHRCQDGGGAQGQRRRASGSTGGVL